MNKVRILLTIALLLIVMFPIPGISKVVNSLGLGMGACLPQGGWDPGYSINTQADFGEAIKYVYLSPYLSFANATKTEEINQNAEQMSIQYIGLGVKLTGYLNSQPRGFYVGGSISYNIISFDEIEWSEYAINTRVINKNTNRIGFTGLAGYLFTLKKLSIFIEIDYMLASGGFNNLSATTGLNISI